MVSNNDASVRVYSVPDLRLLDTIDFRTAVNHSKQSIIKKRKILTNTLLASVSPDGRKMIAVGDDNRVQLFHVTNSGRYELTTTMAGR